MLTPVNLTVEYKYNPIGMDEACPRFSYELMGNAALQTARRIVVTQDDGTIAWDSGAVETSLSIQIEYQGIPLKPFTRYNWYVEATDEKGEKTTSSEEAFFETGFLNEPWTAKWITAGWGGAMRPMNRLIRDFSINGKVKKARLYATALGAYDLYINGVSVDKENCIKPGWSDFFDHVQYQAFDVTQALKDGDNCLAATLAAGWYMSKGYGGTLLLIAEMHILYEDGREERIITDKNWKRFYVHVCNPMRMSHIYDGEIYEAWEETDWMLPGGTRAQSVAAMEHNTPRPMKIIWQEGPSIRRMHKLTPVSIEKRPNATYIVDFGQNFAGREHIHLGKTQKGSTIVMKHGEMLDSDGSLYTQNLRSAWQRTVYTTGNSEDASYEPQYTFFGFRYLEISGWPGELKKEDIFAYAIYSDLRKTGDFHCSEPLLNQLYSNIVWGQRSNFVDVPTDCPQRDERLGWTGDTQVFANVATYNMSCGDFYTKWLRDLNLSRAADGSYYHIAPRPQETIKEFGASGWADAAIVCPDIMLRKYGDKRIVKKYLANMSKWLNAQIDRAGGSPIVDNALFGDWLNVGCDLDRQFISTAYLSGMARTLSEMARAIGDDAISARLFDISKSVKDAFEKKYFTNDGDLTIKMQTAAVLALHFNLCPTEVAKQKTLAFLKDDIVNTRNLHLSTGFLGTPLLLKTLTENGEVDLAYDLLLQTTYPGWLYSVTQGATTMWERWNSWTETDGFGDPEMNSFNHYAYGAVGDWFFETICGIEPAASKFGDGISIDNAAFHHFNLSPKFGCRLKNASATFHSPYGEIKSEWKRDGSIIEWKITIPCNTTATISLPKGQSAQTPEGTPLAETLTAGKYTAIIR